MALAPLVLCLGHGAIRTPEVLEFLRGVLPVAHIVSSERTLGRLAFRIWWLGAYAQGRQADETYRLQWFRLHAKTVALDYW